MYNAKCASDLANDITRSDRYICVYDAGMSRERTKESFVHNHFSEALEKGFFFSRPMPLEKLLESSFIGNLTDDATDRLYQAAAEANLAITYHQHYYAQGGTKRIRRRPGYRRR
jgi:hypothetical protein